MHRFCNTLLEKFRLLCVFHRWNVHIIVYYTIVVDYSIIKPTVNQMFRVRHILEKIHKYSIDPLLTPLFNKAAQIDLDIIIRNSRSLRKTDDGLVIVTVEMSSKENATSNKRTQ